MEPNLRDNSQKTQLELLKIEDPGIQGLLAVYPEEAVEKILANKHKLRKIAAAFNDIKSYSNSNCLIMTCKPSECPYKDICILNTNSMAPEGYACPVEKKIVCDLVVEITEALNIDRDDPIEMELLWDLIDTKLLDLRASGKLKDGTVVQVVTQQISKMVQSKEEISPTLLVKLDLKRLKHSIIDAFVATRRAKKKYGMSSDISSLEAFLASIVAKNRIEHKDE